MTKTKLTAVVLATAATVGLASPSMAVGTIRTFKAGTEIKAEETKVGNIRTFKGNIRTFRGLIRTF